jgi:hypothetical protein
VEFYNQHGGPKVKMIQDVEKGLIPTPDSVENVNYEGDDMVALDKKVLISSDSNPMYLFFMPITSLIWKNFTKYEPIVLLVGNEADYNADPAKKLALDLTREITPHIHFIAPIEGVQDSNLAQISRLYIGTLDLPESTYVLTSDMDMWPLSTTFFHQQNWRKELHIFYANAYGHDKYPICYCGATVATWRRIMRVGKMDTRAALVDQIMAGCGTNASADVMWNYDELLLGLRIKEWPGYPNLCHMIDRQPGPDGPPAGRIDRYKWQFDQFNHKLIDAHLLRPGYTRENWDHLVKLLKCLLKADDFNKMCNYKEEYLKLIQP